MSDRSKIEWTDATVNAINGCTLVSDGCRNCYAARLAATRMKHHPTRAGLARLNADGVAKFNGEVRLNDRALLEPLRWRKSRRIFWNAHGDTFHESVPDAWLDRMFAVIALTPQHTHQVLTKRPSRMRQYINRLTDLGPADQLAPYGARAIEDLPWPLPNLWLGTSIEDQATADARIPDLLATPAAVRFVSAEPLLGPVDLTCLQNHMLDAVSGCRGGMYGHWGPGLDWVICGGESGPQARPMHPDWARALRDQCQEAGVAFHFKQWGEWAPALHDPDDGHILRQTEPVGDFDAWKTSAFDQNRTAGLNWRRLGKARAGRLLDGREWNGMPTCCSSSPIGEADR